MTWICRQWTKTALDGWTSEFDTFETEAEAKQHGETFVELITRDEDERNYEVYEKRDTD